MNTLGCIVLKFGPNIVLIKACYLALGQVCKSKKFYRIICVTHFNSNMATLSNKIVIAKIKPCFEMSKNFIVLHTKLKGLDNVSP